MEKSIRRDFKGQKLRKGEGYREKEQLYSFRWTDKKDGKRKVIYDKTLVGLREREDKIKIGMGDLGKQKEILGTVTLNDAFAAWLNVSPKKQQTKANRIRLWKTHVANDIGEYKVLYIRSSDIKVFYNKLEKHGLAKKTIQIYHEMLYGTFNFLIDDDLIQKNPAKHAFQGQGKAPKQKNALTIAEQERLLQYICLHPVYKKHEPLLKIMLNTGLRCGETIGLTWKDVDFEKRILHVGHQLIYKDIGEGYQFYNVKPKTENGIRMIPLSEETIQMFKVQKKNNFLLHVDSELETAGLNDFVFISKNSRPMMPATLNSILYNIVSSYNKKETERAKKEGCKPELLPKFSAHILRHTACTRLAEKGMNVKALQVYMGHSDFNITMNVYTHIESINTLRNEYERLFEVNVNEPEKTLVQN